MGAPDVVSIERARLRLVRRGERRRRHVEMEAESRSRMEAGLASLSRLACAINDFLPAIAIAQDGVEPALAATDFIATKADGANKGLDRARSLDCLLNCLLRFQDEHLF